MSEQITKPKTEYECKRCGDPHYNNDSVNCSECGYTEDEFKVQRIDKLIDTLDIAFNDFNTSLDDEDELKESVNYFIDWIVNSVMEFYSQAEMAEVVKYIALNISNCTNETEVLQNELQSS